METINDEKDIRISPFLKYHVPNEEISTSMPILNNIQTGDRHESHRRDVPSRKRSHYS